MDKQEWIDRCAARYINRAGLDKKTAEEMALVCYTQAMDDDDDLDQFTPEDAADEDMDCWTNDID